MKAPLQALRKDNVKVVLIHPGPVATAMTEVVSVPCMLQTCQQTATPGSGFLAYCDLQVVHDSDWSGQDAGIRAALCCLRCLRAVAGSEALQLSELFCCAHVMSQSVVLLALLASWIASKHAQAQENQADPGPTCLECKSNTGDCWCSRQAS